MALERHQFAASEPGADGALLDVGLRCCPNIPPVVKCPRHLIAEGKMFGLGFSELVMVLVVALLVFGPEKLPEFARTLGKVTGQLRRTMDDLKHEISLPLREIESSIKSPPPQVGTTSSTPTESRSSGLVAVPTISKEESTSPIEIQPATKSEITE